MTESLLTVVAGGAEALARETRVGRKEADDSSEVTVVTGGKWSNE